MKKTEQVEKVTFDIVIKHTYNIKEFSYLNNNLEKILRVAKLHELKDNEKVIGAEFTLYALKQYSFLKERGHVNGWVTSDIIKKFPYAANIYGNGAHTDYWSEYQPITYAGDMPDKIIEACENVKNLGMKYITAHSLNPFPTKELEKVDPVAIAWIDNPNITINKKNKKVDDYRGVYLQKYVSSQILGIVIGIWDEENEIKTYLSDKNYIITDIGQQNLN